MSEAATENSAKYNCPVCNLTFRRRDRLDRHFFLHTGIVSFLKQISLIKCLLKTLFFR